MRQLIVDCEASGLQAQSYPIQIAWVDIATRETDEFYIKPHHTWQHWDYNAQDIHNIRREELMHTGLSVSDAARRFLDAVDHGNCRVYSDAPACEGFWLGRLLLTAGVTPAVAPLEVAHVLDLLPGRPTQSHMAKIMRSQLRPHDALGDCLMILDAYKQASNCTQGNTSE